MKKTVAELLGTSGLVFAGTGAIVTALTFFLMLTILNFSTGAKEKGITAGIDVGAVIALEAMFAGPICGASMTLATFARRCVCEDGCCAKPKTGSAS